MSTAYMQLQNTTRSSVLAGYSNILFNSVVAQSDTTSVYYDGVTGIITLNEPGAYYIDWYLISQEAENPVTILIEISSDGSSIRSVPANTSMKSNEVTGSAVIVVEEPGVQIMLTNGGGEIILGDVAVVANLVIHSIDMETIVTPNPNARCGGSVVNFQSGVVDCLNPLSWPILLEVLQISWLSDECNILKKICTKSGLEDLFDLPEGCLSHQLIAPQIDPCCLSIIDTIIDIENCLDMFNNVVSDAGLFSTDVYLNHSDIAIMPAIATGDIPLLSLDGPLTPQIIAQDGVITSFAAEYDCVVAVDISLLNTIPGILTTLNNLLDVLAGTIAVLISALGSCGSILAGLGAPLPSNFADTLNKLIMKKLMANTLDSNHHVHAILWKRTDITNLNINWEKVSELDLGPVPWAELAPVDSFVSSIGDIIAAGGNVISTVLSLLSGRGTVNQSPTNTPFRAALNKELYHPISKGDYLLVQFTLVGSDNTTVLAGVIATNLMASVAIDCE